MQGYKAIADHLAQWGGGIGSFVKDLDRRGARYLAFSQVSALEFCPYRYYLEYVQRVRLKPEPDYFVKGRIFHAVAARYYSKLALNQPLSLKSLHAAINRRRRADGHHLRNAITLTVQNAHTGWDIVGVEQPFVLSMGSELPPCIGVIDLVLRKGGDYAVVDHKTGKNFYEQDNLQLLIYREYVRRRYRAESCQAFYDEYRWVENLDSVRKPAFQRTEVELTPDDWTGAMGRIATSYDRMREIEEDGDAPREGSCFMCPYRDFCQQ